jgi:L-fuculose-phosphate aldolase
MFADLDARNAVVDAVRRMNALGINQGKAGNASLRHDDGFLITPSGIAYEALEPDDIVRMGFDGSHVARSGRLRPSSEWRFHLDILKRRPDVSAVVHTHGVAATTLACLGRGIPAFHYMVAVAGGDSIRCAPYATFGTQELSDHALAALEGRQACLLANHGLIATGATLDAALELAVEVETLAEMYWRCLQVGEPAILTSEQMDQVFAQMRTAYGARTEGR